MIKLTNVSKTYYQNKKIAFKINDINIEFPSKGMYFIVGKSGCGKSSLLSLVGLLNKPDNGSIFYDDIDVTKLNDNDRNKFIDNNISYIFQDYNLFPFMTVYENLSLVLKEKVNSDDKINNVLKKLGIEKLIDKNILDLSGGECQRVAIARALLKESKVLFCDEPTGALDNKNSQRVFDLLKELSKDILIIVVSHDLASASTYSDGTIEINDGFIISNTIKSVNDIKKTWTTDKKTKSSKLIKSEKFILNNFSKKKSRLIIATLSTTLLFTVISTMFSFGLNNRQNIIAQSMDKKETNNIFIKGTYSQFNKENYYGFSNETIKEAVSTLDLDYYYPVYSLYSTYNLYYNESSSRSLPFNGSVEISQQLVNDFDFTLYGNLPSDDSQIVITSYYYDQIKNNNLQSLNGFEDLVGKEIELYGSESGEEKCFTISGVLDTNYVKENFLYDNASNSDDVFSRSMYGSMNCLCYLNEGYYSRNELEIKNGYKPYTTTFFSSPYLMLNSYSCNSIRKISSFGSSDTFKLYHLNDADETHTIVVNGNTFLGIKATTMDEYLEKLFNSYASNFYSEVKDQLIELYPDDRNYNKRLINDYYNLIVSNSYNDTLRSKDKEGCIVDLCTLTIKSINNAEDTTLTFGYENTARVKIQDEISGFYFDFDNVNLINDVYLNDNYYDIFLNETEIENYEYCGIVLPFNNVKKATKILKACDNNILSVNDKTISYIYDNVASIKYNNEMGIFDNIFKVFLYVSVVFVILLFLFTNFYTNGLLDNSEKEIGILKSLGFNKVSIFVNYGINSLIVTFGSLLLGTGLSSIILKLIDNILINHGAIVSYCSYSYLSFIICIVLVILINVVTSLIAMNNINKKKTADLLKKE